MDNTWYGCCSCYFDDTRRCAIHGTQQSGTDQPADQLRHPTGAMELKIPGLPLITIKED